MIHLFQFDELDSRSFPFYGFLLALCNSLVMSRHESTRGWGRPIFCICVNIGASWSAVITEVIEYSMRDCNDIFKVFRSRGSRRRWRNNFRMFCCLLLVGVVWRKLKEYEKRMKKVGEVTHATKKNGVMVKIDRIWNKCGGISRQCWWWRIRRNVDNNSRNWRMKGKGKRMIV